MGAKSPERHNSAHSIISYACQGVKFFLDFFCRKCYTFRTGVSCYTKEPNGPMHLVLNVLLVILVIAVIALAVLYFLGRKLEKRQVEQQQLLEMSKQTVSMLVIDKKKMKIKESGLPKIVYEQTPKYMRWAKVPVVKAKVGPKVMTLLADERVFASLPVKTEAKVVVSGLYITEIKSVRGGAIPQAPKKKGFFARFKKDN